MRSQITLIIDTYLIVLHKLVHICIGLRIVLGIIFNKYYYHLARKIIKVTFLCTDYDTFRTKFKLDLLSQGLDRIIRKENKVLIINKGRLLNVQFLLGTKS